MTKWLSGVALGAILGLAGGWYYWGHGPGAPKPESPKAEVRQDDGSLVLERSPEQEATKAPHKIPEGGKETRRVEVTIYPEAPDCPPVDLKLSLVEFGDGSARVVASSDDGRVSGGLDIPFKPFALPAKPRRWASGVTYGAKGGTGFFIERDLWRVRVGLQVNALADGTAEARAVVGWTW